MPIDLFLSSQGFGSVPESLRDSFAIEPGATALVIVNAMDPYPRGRDLSYLEQVTQLEALGFRCVELDLRDYPFTGADLNQVDGQQTAEAPSTSLLKLLTHAQLVWVAGGNTFVLARAMTQARFKMALLQANLDRDIQQMTSLIYGGYSAGAVVAGPDLQGIHLMDDPHVIPADYDPSTEALTLGLIDDRIVPHYQSDNPESPQAEKTVAFLERSNLKYRTLSDGEVWVTHSH